MNVLIIEDEKKLAKQLENLLQLIDGTINVVTVLGTVRAAVEFLKKPVNIDLMLVDVYLSDGLSFEIFEEVPCKAPVIFCTAYNEYALRAFELDSVDYLLKPIKKAELEKAINKFNRIFKEKDYQKNWSVLSKKIENLTKSIDETANSAYRQSFLFPSQDRLIPVSTDEISYFQASYGMVKCVTDDNRSYSIDNTLEAITLKLNPHQFYRVNRQFIIRKDAIVDVEYYFNGRLFLNILPKPKEPIIISKVKASGFKEWLDK